MNTFTDYYTVLGVAANAPSGEIKAAFKRLALQYHPDVYKGEDAHERMRLLLQAYQTLNDPVARRQYDVRRSEHTYDGSVPRVAYAQDASVRSPSRGRAGGEVSPRARRDRQRYYDFPDFLPGQSVHIDLIDFAYTLAPGDARTLMQSGVLRGVAPETEGHMYYCHRCHHRWRASSAQGRQDEPRFCPKCEADDWAEYLLLRCLHCSAVFESEQIRYEIGSYTYGKGSSSQSGRLCPPYELFPLCPYCGSARWSAAEDERVSELRLRATRRAATARLLFVCFVIAVLLVGGYMVLHILQ